MVVDRISRHSFSKLGRFALAVVLHAGGAAPTRFPLPILKFNSENEAPGYYGQRATAHANYRYWEIPGSAHQPLERTEPSLRLLSLARGAGGLPRCPFPYQGAGGPTADDAVLRAGLVGLDRWVRGGPALPADPLIEMTPPLADALPSTEPFALTGGNRGIIQRDRCGNALGGIRLPQQEVPTGRNTPSTGCQVSFGGGMTTLGSYPQWDPSTAARIRSSILRTRSTRPSPRALKPSTATTRTTWRVSSRQPTPCWHRALS